MSKCRPLVAPLPRKSQGVSRGWALATYRQGVDAAKARLPATENPYEDGSDQAAVWQGGWEVGLAE